MKNKKAIAIIASLIIVAGVTITLLLVFLLPSPAVYIGQRKALILCSANDFFGSEPEEPFNDGNDSNFMTGKGNWTYSGPFGSIGEWSAVFGNPLGSLFIMPSSLDAINANFSLDWKGSEYILHEYAYYNMTAEVFIANPEPINGSGIRIGLQWLDSGDQVVRTDWSNYHNSNLNQWFTLSVSGVCNNETNSEISDLRLFLTVNGSYFSINPLEGIVYFDNIEIYKWVLVDLDNPTDPGTPPPPPGINSDGFPAQALQVYWILKNHGYTDENIFLMLYYKDDADGIIDISSRDKYANDLIHDGDPAIIDVANDSITATRFKQELNVSYTGSFASKIHPEDYLIIYMVDHGSNKVLPDGNATFHFEADNSWITEFEFYDLVKDIECQRMMINVDCCFSGNFLNADANIGQSWYDIDNCIMVSASSNLLAWYYINNGNPDGFAGSWFFHMFWDALNRTDTIEGAFNHAFGWPPAARGMPLFMIQMPMMYDNMGINTTLSFISDPPL
ncbi:MAG: C13 family peptidase [Promethearchaeota archaeon]|jgi:hypothetical protein